MAKKKDFKQKKHYSRKMTLPLAVILGFMPLAGRAITEVKSKGINGLPNVLSSIVPYNYSTGKFDASNLSYGLFPIIAGFAVHKLAGSIGVNRAIAQARIPFIRI